MPIGWSLSGGGIPPLPEDRFWPVKHNAKLLGADQDDRTFSGSGLYWIELQGEDAIGDYEFSSNNLSNTVELASFAGTQETGARHLIKTGGDISISTSQLSLSRYGVWDVPEPAAEFQMQQMANGDLTASEDLLCHYVGTFEVTDPDVTDSDLGDTYLDNNTLEGTFVLKEGRTASASNGVITHRPLPFGAAEHQPLARGGLNPQYSIPSGFDKVLIMHGGNDNALGASFWGEPIGSSILIEDGSKIEPDSLLLNGILL